MNPAQDFAVQLMRQVLDDLRGVLMDHRTPVDETQALLVAAASAGRRRGGTLILLANAALQAHRSLMPEEAPDPAAAHEDIAAVLRQLGAEPQARLPALLEAAQAIEQATAAAEPAAPSPTQTLALAIHRLYDGLRNDDESLGGRGLVELRALVVHLDATAGALEQGAQPVRVIRPDRFHDYFLRFTSQAQTQGAGGEERAVAALSRDGRIEALVTEQAAHPITLAAQAVHQMVAGDDTVKDHALARIRALLVFLAALRKQPQAAVGDTLADTDAQLSLIVAAATAPLRLGEEFAFDALAQVARYNLRLLRGSRDAAPRRH
jgi:hypothetical protein